MTMSQINFENIVFKGGYKGVQCEKESFLGLVLMKKPMKEVPSVVCAVV